MILWTVACWAPLFMEFSRQAYWSGLPFPSPGYLPYSGMEPGLLDCRQILYHLSYEGSPIKALLLCYFRWKLRHSPLFHILSNSQAPPSLGFSRQEHWSGLPFLPPGVLPNPGIELRSPTLQADYLPPKTPRKA